MNALQTLVQAAGIAYAAGLNLYATVAVVGLAARLGWIGPLPGSLVGLSSWWVIVVAADAHGRRVRRVARSGGGLGVGHDAFPHPSARRGRAWPPPRHGMVIRHSSSSRRWWAERWP